MKAAFEIAEQDIGGMQIAGDLSERHGRVCDIHQVNVAGQDHLHCIAFALIG
jgi:hypothetical protein